MTRLIWDDTGKRLFETGLDKCVLYVMDQNGKYPLGVAWNGLISLTESPSGAEPSSLYGDNVKYLTLMSVEEFATTLDAYTYPEVFDECDGSKELAIDSGGRITQQPRKKFGLVYRTKLGNDVSGQELGYKLHLVYGCLASPSEKAYAGINDSPEAITFSWEIATTPVNIAGFQPTSLIVVDSTQCSVEGLARLENQLFGDTVTVPNLPLPDAVKTMLEAVWIVSPTGTITGAGTLTDPRDLSSLIGLSSPIKPGEKIYMRGTPLNVWPIDARGMYTPLVAGQTGLAYLDGRAGIEGKGCYTLKINGVNGNPITIRNYPGENARINGGLHATSGQASHITLYGVEVAPTPTTRSFATESDVDFPSIYMTGAGIKLYNNYLHDLGSIYPFEVTGFDMNGNIVLNNGFYTVNLGVNRNYSIYGHNDGGGAVEISKNAFLNPFAPSSVSAPYNVHMYSGSARVIDYNLHHNILSNGAIIFQQDTLRSDGNKANDNYFYGRDSGVVAITNINNANPSSVEALRNHIRETLGFFGLTSIGFKNINFQSNTVVATGVGSDEIARYEANNTPGTISWDNNLYKPDDDTGFSYLVNPASYYTFPNWKIATGFDANTTQTGLPTINVTGVIKTDHGRRGFVAIYNYSGGASVTVDLTALQFIDGAHCRYYNALNMAEYIDFTYDADNPMLTISMLAVDWSVAQPTAYDSPVAWYTEPYPNFGVWLVEDLEN